jgi:hypothetical protein
LATAGRQDGAIRIYDGASGGLIRTLGYTVARLRGLVGAARGVMQLVGCELAGGQVRLVAG